MFRSWVRRALVTSVGASAGLCVYLGTADVYAGPIGRIIKQLDPERAHDLAIQLAKRNWVAPPRFPFIPPAKDPPSLSTSLWGLQFSHPIGLAAGFDKNGEAVPGLFGVGFSFIEVGTVTPRPQPGNPKPRVFRLEEDSAIINRYGFNSHGATAVYNRLYTFNYGGRSQDRYGPLGVNIGKNKDTNSEDAVDDYLHGLDVFGELAEYIVINVSSPNTPGLRALQQEDSLRKILGPLFKRRDRLMFRPPIVVKIAPDLTDDELDAICTVAAELNVDGLIVSNTTIDKSGLTSKHRDEKGGVSGRPLREKSNEIIRKVYKKTKGKIPIIGVGGVENGQDAYDKIRAGASLIQIYTAFAYQGPWVVHRMKKQLASLLERDGFATVADVVGVEHRGTTTSCLVNTSR